MPAVDQDRISKARRFDYIVGTNIRTLRVKNDYTQEFLAELLDMSSSQLSRVEAGERSLSFQQGLAAALHLGIVPEDLGKAPKGLRNAA